MEYSLQALPNGKCVVREDVVFSGGSTEVVHPFYLYIWLIRGGGHTIVVDTGPKDLAAFNRGTAEYIPGGVTQEPDEETVAALAKAGVLPEDVDHVILTHLHGDHAHNFYLFENAKLVASRRGIVDGFPRSLPKVLLEPLIPGWPDSLVLTEDEEVLPGIRCFWVGAHSACSQGIAVDTARGRFVLAGDAAYLFANVEENRAIGWADADDSLAALEKLRAAGDVVLPGHDPLIMQRYPGGVVA